MTNEELCKDVPKDFKFLIFRTLSTVRPGMMSQFMNSITWQAAWLRHCLHWDRVVVGYALTGVPERVLEIYGIPYDDMDRAKRGLDRLHAQTKEYGQLMECCMPGPQSRQEVFLTSMQYHTLMREFVWRRKREFDLIDSEAESRRRLEDARKMLARRICLQERARILSAKLHDRNSPEAIEFDNISEELSLMPTESVLRKINKERQEELDAVERRVEEARRSREFSDLDIPAYYLDVDTKVLSDAQAVPAGRSAAEQGLGKGLGKGRSLEIFAQRMTKMLDDFKWEFIAAGQYVSDQHTQTPEEEREHEIMHLWTFGDANDLYRQMVEMRENQKYSDLEKVIKQQSHTLMCDWETISKTQRTPPFPNLVLSEPDLT